LEFDVEVKVDSDNQALTFEGKDTDTLRAYLKPAMRFWLRGIGMSPQ